MSSSTRSQCPSNEFSQEPGSEAKSAFQLSVGGIDDGGVGGGGTANDQSHPERRPVDAETGMVDAIARIGDVALDEFAEDDVPNLENHRRIPQIIILMDFKDRLMRAPESLL